VLLRRRATNFHIFRTSVTPLGKTEFQGFKVLGFQGFKVSKTRCLWWLEALPLHQRLFIAKL